jgi:hypothetical protein
MRRQRKPRTPERQCLGDRHRPHDLQGHRSLAWSGLHQLGTHPRQGAALEPGDVHLGAADPGGDLILVQVLEEPQHDDLTLQSREGGEQAAQGQ